MQLRDSAEGLLALTARSLPWLALAGTARPRPQPAQPQPASQPASQILASAMAGSSVGEAPWQRGGNPQIGGGSGRGSKLGGQQTTDPSKSPGAGVVAVTAASQTVWHSRQGPRPAALALLEAMSSLLGSARLAGRERASAPPFFSFWAQPALRLHLHFSSSSPTSKTDRRWNPTIEPIPLWLQLFSTSSITTRDPVWKHHHQSHRCTLSRAVSSLLFLFILGASRVYPFANHWLSQP